MKKFKKLVIGALAVAGAWCAEAADAVTYLEPVFGKYGETTGFVTNTVTDYTLHKDRDVDEETWNSGWYVIEGDVKVDVALHMEGDVKIILKDGATLTVNKSWHNNGGFRVEGSHKLTVYAQSTDVKTMGKIVANGGENGSGIGSHGESDDDRVSSGYITINGGVIEAQGGKWAAGIGGGEYGDGRRVTINGGTVTAAGGSYGAGIGGGYKGAGITINGGTVTATGGEDAAGIGGGFNGAGADIMINGGAVTATGGYGGAGIGGGINGAAQNITIIGGVVTAAGGYAGAGIGGGYEGAGADITINGGVVTATGGKYGTGIGGGWKGNGIGITINGGAVTATGGEFGAGIGGGDGGASSDIYVADSVILKAGASANPTEVIPHASPTMDIAALLRGKRYATAMGTLGVRTWADLKSNLEAGNSVRLVADVAQDAVESHVALETAGMDVTLNLNGHTVSLQEKSRLVTLGVTVAGVSFTLVDSVGTGVVTGGRAWDGGCVWIGAGSTFVMNGGTITNCVASNEGGAVYNNGSFTMNGGTICGNSSTSYGYAVRTGNGSTFTMTGGQIVNNRGTCAGALAASYAIVNISGGVMKGNSSVNQGTIAQWRNIQSYYCTTTVTGGIFDAEPSVANIIFNGGTVAVGSYSLIGENWIIGSGIATDANDRLTGGIYTFCPTNAEYAAAGVAVAPNVTMTVSDTTYTLNATGAVELSDWSHVKANLEAGNCVKLAADVAQDAPGVVLNAKTATLDLNGFTITGTNETDAAYRPLTLSNGAKLTLTDSSPAKTGSIDGQGVSRNLNGGCVSVGAGCAFTMTGGTIINCTANIGGGVAVDGGGAFNLSGGAITGNTSAQWGGGVYLIYGATMVFSGGEISYNTAKDSTYGGGGICSSGRVTMTGGTITGNVSGNSASTAIYSNWDDSDAIYGGVIDGTIFRADTGDLVIYGGVFDRDQSSLLASGKSGTPVGSKWIVGSDIVCDQNDRLTGGTYTFCPTNAEYAAAGVVDPTMVAATGSDMNYTLNATVAVELSDWAHVKANLETGNDVKLVADVAQDGPGVALNAKAAMLDLNGFTITGSGETDGTYRPFALSNGAKLTLIDSSDAKTGAIDGQGVVRNVNGGCVSVGAGCTFTMTGGTITNCVAAAGGGVMVEGGGSFDLSGGTIIGNTATQWGGGVHIASGGTMTFIGGEVSCNTANNDYIGGGGICSSGKMTMTGGKMTGNLSANPASTAVYSNCDDCDVIYGGVIDGTIYRENAGDLVIYGGVFDCDQLSLVASGKTCTKVGSNWIVGDGIVGSANGKLYAGTFTFCPTNAEYSAAGVAVGEIVEIRENETELETWTLSPIEFIAVPTPVAHATAAVYTNGVLSAETSFGSGEWYVWTNETATVVYTAEESYCFAGGATVVTNALDTTVNPAANAGDPPRVLPQIAYVDEKGDTQIANAHIVVASGSRVTWTVGWYAVTNDVTIAGGVDVSGAVKLILADGVKLTINGVAENNAGIRVEGDGDSFALYGQVAGTGALEATGGQYGAGIGGGIGSSGSNITINGGTATANGGRLGAGIGGGRLGAGSSITINGGTVTAKGGRLGAGIGGGEHGSGSNITINGGTVTAMRQAFGAGIGGGDHGSGSNITINGGSVTATDSFDGVGVGGAGIGGGEYGSGSDITINGGTVMATGSPFAAGIGGGEYGSGSNITINGGTVTATGGRLGADGIGGGIGSTASDIYVADSVLIRAGASPDPAEVIPHASITTDIASLLAGKQYATAEGMVEVSNWTDLKTNLEAGKSVRLKQSVSQDALGVALDGKTVTLDLNGFTITGSGQMDGSYRPFMLSNGAKLTLTDSSAAKTGAIDGKGVVRDANGGCVSVGAGCTFTMTGGTITNCVAAQGGAVYNLGTFTMISGTMTGNHSDDSASTAIYSNSDSTNPIIGGVIGGTISCKTGGGLVISGGVFDRDQSSLLASGKTCTKVGANWIVGADIACDADNQLTAGTYTFDPTKAEYAAAGVLISDVAELKENATEPKTWTLLIPSILKHVAYVDEDGEMRTTNAEVVVSCVRRETWKAGWYVVTNDVTITGGADCSGAVKLILADGAKLTISGVADRNAGIGVSGEGHSFAIYGQVGGTGALSVAGGDFGAGIGGGNKGAGSNITVNGGVVTATGGYFGAGIGGGGAAAAGSNITINGGTVAATGGDWGGEGGAGIGGGYMGTSSNIYIADNVILKAGDSPNPTEVIPHASRTTDVASLLAGKRYATAETDTYPGYLAKYGDAMKAKFDAWANTFGSRDPDGIYQNAFLLNVATNREAEAEAAFRIGSIVVTNEVVGTVTNTVVVLEGAKPLAPSTNFNGITWLQCATNGLNEAAWLDIESGRYTEGENSFFIQRIDFEHTLTPEAFPVEPTGTKTIQLRVK